MAPAALPYRSTRRCPASILDEIADAMTSERRLRILSQLAAFGESVTDRLCTVSRDVTAMTGAGIMLMVGPTSRGSLCTTNEVSALIEELQLTLSEGPCVDAHNLAFPVFEPDLDAMTGRWLSFTPLALRAGVRAIFGFPLHVKSARIGALNLYRDLPGPMTEDQLADALVTADLVARAVLTMQADASSGELAMELEPAVALRSVVHQATGVVAAQLGASVEQAQIRLKAYAFANDRPLSVVAREVVMRDLRFGGPS